MPKATSEGILYSRSIMTAEGYATPSPAGANTDDQRRPRIAREILTTPLLVVLTFLLLLDVLVLLGGGHDSRDGRDWQPRGSPLARPVDWCAR